MKKIDKSYLKKKINKLNKKVHRAESQNEENKTWWRKLKITKLKERLNQKTQNEKNFFSNSHFNNFFI